MLRGAVRVLVDELPYVTLLLRVRGNSDVERQALERRRAFDHEITGMVRAAQQEGTVRADVDASVATRLLFGMVNSIVEWYRPTGPEGAAELAARRADRRAGRPPHPLTRETLDARRALQPCNVESAGVRVRSAQDAGLAWIA